MEKVQILILDDGGDATMMVHKGLEYLESGDIPIIGSEDSEEWGVFK